MIYVAMKPASAAPPFVSSGIRHPVTPEMLKAAGAMSTKAAPFFERKDLRGQDVRIGGAGERPQFVYFILSGCPCSVDVQPLFNKMAARYGDKADFIGVINVGPEKAKDYAGENTVLHPIVSEPGLQVMKAYGAKQSVYSALVRPDGTIERMWPGYSESMLHELNRRLAQLTGIKEEAFDAKYAPKELASGCFF